MIAYLVAETRGNLQAQTVPNADTNVVALPIAVPVRTFVPMNVPPSLFPITDDATAELGVFICGFALLVELVHRERLQQRGIDPAAPVQWCIAPHDRMSI